MLLLYIVGGTIAIIGAFIGFILELQFGLGVVIFSAIIIVPAFIFDEWRKKTTKEKTEEEE
jgi:membrane protein implicated in regulation of membrane protease activity